MSRNISIQDIAVAAGVSHTTVSRALRNSPLISLEVREQIKILAQEMGYTPNALAQALRRQHTNSIGLVVTTISDPFVGRVVRGIEEVAQEFNLSIFLSVSSNDSDREMAAIERLHQRRVDGIIVAASKISAEYESRIVRMGVPTVLINQQAETNLTHIHSVSVDDYTGARKAIEHFLDLGHRRIGYIGSSNRPRSNRIRLQAYRDTLTAAGMSCDDAQVRIPAAEHKHHADDVADGATFLPHLIQAGVSAVFCYNDMIATGALLSCRSLGIPVPQRLSIIGFDDVELAQYVSPPLTTVHQPKLTLGRLAMEMLLDLLADRQVTDHVLPTELVIRASTARHFQNQP